MRRPLSVRFPVEKPAESKHFVAPHHLSDISCPYVCHSVGSNSIMGNAANHLATVVLEHAAMTEFCWIPLVALRENSIVELDLEGKGVGVPGANVLSKLLPSAAALTLLKCACRPRVLTFLSAPADTVPPFQLGQQPALRPRR